MWLYCRCTGSLHRWCWPYFWWDRDVSRLYLVVDGGVGSLMWQSLFETVGRWLRVLFDEVIHAEEDGA